MQLIDRDADLLVTTGTGTDDTSFGHKYTILHYAVIHKDQELIGKLKQHRQYNDLLRAVNDQDQTPLLNCPRNL